MLSFTGSGPVGWGICEAVPRKHVTLELGGNAAVVVASDYEDLAWAARRIATFSMYQAGQSCVAVQRVLCVPERYDELREHIVDQVRLLRTGDPAHPATDVGPLIDDAAAKRVQAWVDEAVAAGGRLLCGGRLRAVLMLLPSLRTFPSAAPCLRTRSLVPFSCCNEPRP